MASPELAPKQPSRQNIMAKYICPAVVLTVLLTILTGLIYPRVVTVLAQLIFPYQANGSLHYVNGKLVGSDLIGQYWTSSKYFHGRPSVTVSAATAHPSHMPPTTQPPPTWGRPTHNCLQAMEAR